MGYLWNPVPVPVFTQSGGFASGARAYFYVGNSSTPLVVFHDAALTHPQPWPVIADNTGVFPSIYVPYGPYRRRITTAAGVLISDTGDIDNPAPPSGGGGVVVTADEILQTGDPIWRLRYGQMVGFVRMNGLTLGDAASGATEFASPVASALFSFLWTYLPDSIATVSGGRGASATADFAANKTIVIPTMQGFAAAGVDGMGATDAAKIQAITTCTTDGATGVVTVASATGIAVGQYAIVNGVAAGTITAVVGTSVTLSATPAGPAAGVSFRSSFFSDAELVGAAAGAANAQPTTDQLPAHLHPITDVQHSHNTNSSPAGSGTPTIVFSNQGPASPSGVYTLPAYTGITGTDNAGGGNPFALLQPTRLGTFYMKL
jgi:hypothetical protein